MEVLEAFAEVLEAFMGMTSTNTLMEASVVASIEDMDDLKASTRVTFHGSFHESFDESFHGSNL